MLKTVSSITNAIGALNYKGTWNASTNTPALASGVGTKGDYYVVSVAGTTALDGISSWGVGDWVTFNGSVWQRVEGGADLNGVNLSVSGTSTLDGSVTFKDNLTQGTAAKGVDFTANTPAAGMTSQLLNWYEEGTWTPSTAGDATGAFSSAEGVYTRVGNIVTATCFLIVSSNFTSNDIGGLPFTCRAGFGGTSNNFISSVLTNSGTTAIFAMVRGSDTKIGFFEQNAGTSHLPNTTNLSYRLTAVYMV